MRLKFDENVSTRLVEAIRKLEPDPGIEIGSVHWDYGEGTSDPDWMFRFREEGGVAMISGDHRILQNPVNLKAYTASGLISVWPPAGWPELRRFGQAALLIRWWPVIKLKIAASNPGDRWRIDPSFTPSVEKLKPILDPRIDQPPTS